MIELRARGWMIACGRLGMLALIGLAASGCPGSVSSGPGGGNTNVGGGGTAGTSGTAGTGGTGGSCTPGQEICDGQDNDCDGEIDDVPNGCTCNDGETQDCYAGPEGTEGVGACVKGTQTCAGGVWGDCEGQVTPQGEACNLQDDNCDGETDNMGTVKCGIGACEATVEACVQGQAQTCVPGQPSIEVCDGVDNNCNQLTDEADPDLDKSCMTGLLGPCKTGKFVCNAGALECAGAVFPGTETCDGVDNDCDGTADNNIGGTGGPCSTGQFGVCNAGTISCAFVAGAWSIDCYSMVMPSADVCDGLDNNCDGQNDENDPGGGGTCNTGEAGVCAPGELHCSGGSIKCLSIQMPSAELCNNKDDDCDGLTDEGDPGGSMACNTGFPGICNAGTTACSAGAIVCNQNLPAGVESCNSIDDDCDGVVDDNNPGGGAFCSTGNLGVCAAGTITCQGGQLNCKQDLQPSAEVCGNALDENCDGVAVASPTVYFNETFANNAAGWTLDANWSIGPTVMSAPTGSCGGGDPALDHTATADNGVAGNVLGGNVSQALGGPYYITSPIIDTSAAPTLFLEYWRWLHSDYPPFMIDKVEVYNGASWVSVWNNPGSVVNDVAWTKMSHNVTAYKNANFRVRFSYQIGSGGVYLCAGWNVDDVQLVNAQCN